MAVTSPEPRRSAASFTIVSTVQVGSLAIVGTGLIGASVGLAARRAGVAVVTGWDPDAEALGVAAERGAVEPAGSLANAVAGAELVVVAAPVGELPHTVREVLTHAGEACTVTDVGSTKRPVCAAAASDLRFVGEFDVRGRSAGLHLWTLAESGDAPPVGSQAARVESA